MSKPPLVSVITPFYNTPPQFMRECIDSVLGQSCQEWELLLLDDGSGEDSTSLALRYASQYPNRVRYLDHAGHRNRGPGATRQLGIDSARGEFVAFLDSDDLWLPHKLEQQVPILEAHPEVDMLYGNSLYWYGWTGNPDDSQLDYQPRLGLAPNTIVEPPELCALLLDAKIAVPVPCSVVVRRSLLVRVGGFEGAAAFPYDDQSLFVKIFLKGRVFVSGACWDKYRQHSGSGCWQAEAAGQIHGAHLSFLDWTSQYLSTQGCTHPGIWQAVQRQRWLYNLPGWLKPGSVPFHLMRRVRKRLLWMEERALPPPARRWLWAR